MAPREPLGPLGACEDLDVKLDMLQLLKLQRCVMDRRGVMRERRQGQGKLYARSVRAKVERDALGPHMLT